ncbi:MAG TPA: glycoside hydrolase family 172 protein [Planctomycetaceae bacterium]|nr:glycoside hydrolase family 172 protein [Planctomycetaceae bacterium]
MQRNIRLSLAALLMGLWLRSVSAADKVTLENLLPQMTNLSLLCEYPDPPYVTKQFSSYDRASEAPGSDSWFANADRGFMLYDGILKEETPYFKTAPIPGNPPDGHFAAGTRVGIAPTHKRMSGYVWAYATAADGRAENGKIPQGYVALSAITLDPQGHVLAEMDGPGCVVRIWSANPKDAGKIRIYLDGAEKPVIDAPLEALLGGKWKTTIDGKETIPFPDPLACERSRGFNLYFPIAYARHCKITIDHPSIYYHVDYRTYPKGTEVETFSLEGLGRVSRQLQEVVEGLRHPTSVRAASDTLSPAVKAPHFAQTVNGTLKPGQKATVHSHGPAAIKLIGARLSVPNNSAAVPPAEGWRSVIFLATFDGAPQPQIWCPLGEFFASSPSFQRYSSLPIDVGGPQARDEMRAWWTMPFKKSMDIELRNLGRQTVKFDLLITVDGYTWTDHSMHFHAKWRTETLQSRPFRDWTYCDLKGKGVFVGDMLSLVNPVRAWWGEGDEKIYVDGETFPSWFGTGSEDYYGYAWSDPKPFQHPYHNQTRCDGPGNRGWTSVNRFHILDNIPFEKSFRFDMEFWHWTPNIDVPYAATSYWYARPGGTDDFHEPDAGVLQKLPSAPPSAQAYRIKGALEGEDLKINKKNSDFDAGPQDMTAFDGNWSGASHLWGRPSKSGEWLDLELPVATEGRHHVIVYLTKARDYGVVQFHLNGKPLGKPIDGFHPDSVVATGAIDLGVVELKPGVATLRVEVVGTNPKSDGLRYMWGLDCVVLQPASE